MCGICCCCVFCFWVLLLYHSFQLVACYGWLHLFKSVTLRVCVKVGCCVCYVCGRTLMVLCFWYMKRSNKHIKEHDHASDMHAQNAEPKHITTYRDTETQRHTKTHKNTQRHRDKPTHRHTHIQIHVKNTQIHVNTHKYTPTELSNEKQTHELFVLLLLIFVTLLLFFLFLFEMQQRLGVAPVLLFVV